MTPGGRRPATAAHPHTPRLPTHPTATVLSIERNLAMSTLRTHLARLHRQRRQGTAYRRSTPHPHSTGRTAAPSPSAQPSHSFPHVLTGLR